MALVIVYLWVVHRHIYEEKFDIPFFTQFDNLIKIM